MQDPLSQPVGLRGHPWRRAGDPGFTLVELLVVIVIVGVLAAIAVPIYLNQRQKANVASLRADMRQFRTLLQTHTLEGGTSGPKCFSAEDCAQSGYIADLASGDPLNLVLSPGNRIGDFWGGWKYGTFHICIEHWSGGQPQEWVAYDTYGAGVDMGHGTTGGCPWVDVGVKG